MDKPKGLKAGAPREGTGQKVGNAAAGGAGGKGAPVGKDSVGLESQGWEWEGGGRRSGSCRAKVTFLPHLPSLGSNRSESRGTGPVFLDAPLPQHAAEVRHPGPPACPLL